MFEKTISREQAATFIFGFMVQAAIGVIKNYHGDLYHDAVCLKKADDSKSLVDRQIEDGESLFWSVGDCGTHFSLCTDPKQRAWMCFESYAKYKHYQVWFSIAESGLITAQLITLEA